MLEPIPTTPTPVHGALYPPIPVKTPTLHTVLEPIPLTPPIFEERKESSASLLHSTPPNTFYPISPAPIFKPIPVHGAPYPPIPDKAPTFHDVLEPIPEESNNDLIDNEKGQQKANDDVKVVYAEEINKEPIIIEGEAKPMINSLKEATKFINAANYDNLKELKKMYNELGGKNDYEKSMVKYREGIQALKAKKQYMELGGENDYGENIEEYKNAIQALKYKKLLHKKGSKLTDEKKEKIFNFHNANYEPPINDANRLNVKALKEAFNFTI